MTTDSQLLLADDHLVADFPYDAEQVKEIKNIAGAKWDKVARVWRVPVSSIAELRAFAERHRFWVAPEVLRFDLPQTGLPDPGVRLADDTTIGRLVNHVLEPSGERPAGPYAKAVSEWEKLEIEDIQS